MKLRDWIALGAAVTLVLLGALPVLGYPLARDTGVFGVIAARWLDGGLPFVDAWDFKPPAIYALYAGALALFGRGPAALRALDLLAFPLMALCLYWIARRRSGESRTAGLLAVLAFGAFYFRESFWTLTQNDGLVLPAMVGAFVCAALAAERPGGRGWAFAAGVLAALTLWFKYTFVLFIAALVLGQLLRLRAAGRPLLSGAVPFAAGGLLVGLGGMALLAALGILDETIESALLVAPYAGMYTADQAWTESPVWIAGVQERLTLWGPLLILAVLWLPLRLREWRRVSADRWALWLWALAMLINVLWQAKGISYQWLPILPPLLLIALDALLELSRAAAARWTALNGERIRRAAAGGLALLLIGTLVAQTWLPALPYYAGRESQAQYYARFVGGEFRADESLAVAEYLRARVAPGNTLYIWGFRPEIYLLTSTRPATRFISQFPLVSAWYPPAWKQENVDRLWAALPPYVLVLRGDNMPWVTGRTEDSRQLLQEYTELNNWLIANYTEDTTIGSFIVYRRSGP